LPRDQSRAGTGNVARSRGGPEKFLRARASYTGQGVVVGGTATASNRPQLTVTYQP